MRQAIAPPIHVSLRPSRVLRIWVLALTVPALLAIHLSALPQMLLAVVPASAWWAWRALASNLPLTLVFRCDGRLAWLDDNGDEHPAQALALHERGPLGTLAFAVDGRRRDVAWAADSLPRATRRELRLWMRDHARSTAGRTPATSSPGKSTSTTG